MTFELSILEKQYNEMPDKTKAEIKSSKEVKVQVLHDGDWLEVYYFINDDGCLSADVIFEGKSIYCGAVENN